MCNIVDVYIHIHTSGLRVTRVPGSDVASLGIERFQSLGCPCACLLLILPLKGSLRCDDTQTPNLSKITATSIVVPCFGLTNFILRISEDPIRYQNGTTMQTTTTTEPRFRGSLRLNLPNYIDMKSCSSCCCDSYYKYYHYHCCYY